MGTESSVLFFSVALIQTGWSVENVVLYCTTSAWQSNKWNTDTDGCTTQKGFVTTKIQTGKLGEDSAVCTASTCVE